MDCPSCTISHPDGLLSSTQPGGAPFWAGPLAFSLIGKFTSKYSILYLMEMEVCTARQEVYSAGMEDRQYMKKRVVLLQI